MESRASNGVILDGAVAKGSIPGKTSNLNRARGIGCENLERSSSEINT